MTKKTKIIEYEWFEPGTKVVFRRGGNDEVYEVESCREPDGSHGARCEFKGGKGSFWNTSGLKEVTVVKSSVHENESNELKPCPFCGSTNPSISKRNMGVGHSAFVICLDCGGNIDNGCRYCDEEAIEVWNRRV